MTKMQKIRVPWLLVGLLALLLAQPTRAAAPRAFQCGGWSIVPSPNPYTANFLYGVAAVSASDVWAVGAGPLIEHWDGTSWQVAPSPGISWSALNAVTALSASDIWAVGYAQQESQTLIEHWDGSQWSIIPSPRGSSYHNYLASVSAVSANDIWTVGFDEVAPGGRYHPLIEHWDGSAWSLVKIPNVGGNDNFLFGVSVVSSQDVWAVGHYAVGRYGEVPLVEHWDGARWSRVHGVPGGKSTGFAAVTALQTNNVWAVGNYGSGDTAIDQWDGQRWRHVSSPNPPDGVAYSLSSVSAASATDIWTVSSYTNFSHDLNLAQTLTEHWDGTQWSIMPSPNMQDAAGKTSLDNFLNGVAMVPSTHTAWAVGYDGPHDGSTDKTLIEYYC